MTDASKLTNEELAEFLDGNVAWQKHMTDLMECCEILGRSSGDKMVGMFQEAARRLRAADEESQLFDTTGFLRKLMTEKLGFCPAFIDDAGMLAVCLAVRAVLAGLAQDCDPETLKTMVAAAEKSRAGMEKALGFPINDIGRKVKA